MVWLLVVAAAALLAAARNLRWFCAMVLSSSKNVNRMNSGSWICFLYGYVNVVSQRNRLEYRFKEFKPRELLLRRIGVNSPVCLRSLHAGRVKAFSLLALSVSRQNKGQNLSRSKV